MQIRNSLEWAKVQSELRQAMMRASLSYDYKVQARKMIANIGTQVTALSNCELTFRRNPVALNIRTTDEHIEKINADIHSFEQWLLIFILSK